MVDSCISHCVIQVIGEKDTIWGTLTSGAHIISELVYGAFEEIFTGLILYPLFRRYIRNHDRKVHEK